MKTGNLSEMVIKGNRQPTFVLLNDALPPDSSHCDILGRFVAQPFNPTDEYAPTSTCVQSLHGLISSPPDGHDPVIETTRSSVNRQYQSTQSDAVKTRLEHLLTLGGTATRTADWRADAGCLITRRLAQHRRVFHALMRDDSVRAEVLDLLADNGGRAYMAVATRSYVDATVSVNGGADRSAQAEAALPVGEVLTAASGGAILASNSAPRLDATMSRERRAGWTESFRAEGEWVFQIEYRVIRLRRPMFGLGSGPGTAKFGHIAAVEIGSGTFSGGPCHLSGSRVDSAPAGLTGDGHYDDSDEDDAELDEDVGISEEPLEDDGALDSLLVTVDGSAL